MTMQRCRCGRPAVIKGMCEECAQGLRGRLFNQLDELTQVKLERRERGSAFRGSERVVAQVMIENIPRVVYAAAVCPVCSGDCVRPRILYSRLGAPRKHTDLYREYAPLDVTRYEVTVCTGCGYAALDHEFWPLNLADATVFQTENQNWGLAGNYEGERTEAEALVAYRMALHFARRRHTRPLGAAGRVHLRLAWLHRRAGRREQELAAMQQAVAAIEQSLAAEHWSDPAAYAQLQYIVGELHLRLGNFEDAHHWLHRLVTDGRAGTEKATAKMARTRLEDALIARRNGADLAAIRWYFD